MSSVSYGSIKRFETTGQISLLSLTKIATALGVSYQDIQEVINERKFGNVFIGRYLGNSLKEFGYGKKKFNLRGE